MTYIKLFKNCLQIIPIPSWRKTPNYNHRSSPNQRNTMNLFNIIKNQLIQVIEWNDDSRDTLSYRWPDDDKPESVS